MQALADQVVVVVPLLPTLHLVVLEILLAPHHHKEIMAARVAPITPEAAEAEAALVRLDQERALALVLQLEMVAMVPHHLSLALL